MSGVGSESRETGHKCQKCGWDTCDGFCQRCLESRGVEEAAESSLEELKAALRKAVKIARIFHGKIPVLALSEKSYNAFAEAGKELKEVEDMLTGGEGSGD